VFKEEIKLNTNIFVLTLSWLEWFGWFLSGFWWCWCFDRWGWRWWCVCWWGWIVCYSFRLLGW
jgi:hypothetical protein